MDEPNTYFSENRYKSHQSTSAFFIYFHAPLDLDDKYVIDYSERNYHVEKFGPLYKVILLNYLRKKRIYMEESNEFSLGCFGRSGCQLSPLLSNYGSS